MEQLTGNYNCRYLKSMTIYVYFSALSLMLSTLFIAVFNFQSMKNPMELNNLLLNFFVMSPGFTRDENGGLASKHIFEVLLFL